MPHAEYETIDVDISPSGLTFHSASNIHRAIHDAVYSLGDSNYYVTPGLRSPVTVDRLAVDDVMASCLTQTMKRIGPGTSSPSICDKPIKVDNSVPQGEIWFMKNGAPVFRLAGIKTG